MFINIQNILGVLLCQGNKNINLFGIYLILLLTFQSKITFNFRLWN